MVRERGQREGRVGRERENSIMIINFRDLASWNLSNWNKARAVAPPLIPTLLAVGFGLTTCTKRALVSFPEPIRNHGP